MNEMPNRESAHSMQLTQYPTSRNNSRMEEVMTFLSEGVKLFQCSTQPETPSSGSFQFFRGSNGAI